MTLEEKLQNFYNSSIESARSSAQAQIEEHEAALADMFKEHKEAAARQAEDELKAETEKLRREQNKRLSTEQLAIKRAISKKTMELKDKLISEVIEGLRAFKQTPEYHTYLERKIREARDFASGDPVTIYLAPADAPLRGQLEQSCGVSLTISQEDFKGGVRAVIPDRHILIDNSFLTLLNEEKEAFVFHGGASHE